MVAKKVRNRYKRWFFILLGLNIIYFTFQFYTLPLSVNQVKNYFFQFFYSPKVPTGPYIYGIDVSEYQGIINWESVSQINDGHQINFVIVRSTAGRNKRDRFFTSNFREAKKHNFIRGAYHYYRPNENSNDQASNFIKNVKLASGDLPPILDIEKISSVQSLKSLKTGIKNWLNIIEDHYGIKPILYTGAHYYKDYLKDEFTNYHIWIANYNQVEDPLRNQNWSLWQFSDNGSVRGIKGPVDLDLFNGNLADFKKYLLK